MKTKRPVMLQFLFDGHLARRFAQHVERLGAEKVPQIIQSLLSAALVDPAFLLKHLRKYDFLTRQVSTQRGLIKPEVISIPCEDEAERRALRRTILAVTVEVSASLDGCVLPDPTTVVAALVECWVADVIATKRRGERAKKDAQSAFTRPAKRFRRCELPPLTPPVRRALKKVGGVSKKAAERRIEPHPDYPDVAKHPIKWKPGFRGRPPKGAWCNGYGVWVPPEGWRVIRRRWHPPTEAREAVSSSGEASSGEQHDADQADDPAGDDDQLGSYPRPVLNPAQSPPAGVPQH